MRRPARLRSALLGATIVLTLGNGAAFARDLYVAPDGQAQNDGSQARPLDLRTALSSTGPARPGDTIWLRGGIYRGSFISTLTGTATAPIIVRQYPNERAIIDSAPSPTDALSARGAYTWFWGFEIRNSDPQRLSSQTGSWPTDLKRGHGVYATGRGLKFINLVVHDMTNGFGVWTESEGTEVYGSIVYYNGWRAPDRAHGHGIYTQNRVATRRIVDNILFDQFSHGIHAYGSDAAYIDHITLEGNITFNSGTLGGEATRDILLGGGRRAQNPVVRENSTYGISQVNLGYAAGCSNGEMVDNFIVGSGLLLVNCSPALTGNRVVSIYGLGAMPQAFPQNSWYPAPSRPTGTWVRVRPNQYERGRAHVVVYNWDRRSSVSVDLSAAGLASGDEFEVRNAQDYFGTPVLTRVYDGRPVSLPMSGLNVQPPVGNVPVQPVHPGPEFAVFVIVPRTPGSGGGEVVTASLTAAPTSIGAGEQATLSWETSGAASVNISPGIGDVAASGSRTVSPSSTTTYTLTSTDSTGRTATDTATVTVSSNSAPTVALVQPGANSTMTAPATVTFAANASDADGIGRVEFFQNGQLVGTDTTAPYTATWTNVPAGTYTLTARAHDTRGQSATSAPVTLTVSPAQSGGGSGSGPVTIALTSPANGSVHALPATINLVAAVTGSGVARVEFYRNGVPMGSDRAAPFEWRWTYEAPGGFQLVAKAFDSGNRVLATSAPVTITLNRRPVISITAPSSGATVARGQSVRIETFASDPDGSVARVEFYAGSTLIGTDTSAPFSAQWTPGTAGSYVLTARATDNRGTTTTSAGVTVTVR